MLKRRGGFAMALADRTGEGERQLEPIPGQLGGFGRRKPVLAPESAARRLEEASGGAHLEPDALTGGPLCAIKTVLLRDVR